MTTIAVKETKENWQDPFFTLFIDNEQSSFHHYASRRLTDTDDENGNGIFNEEKSAVSFQRKDTWVTVDFETTWDIASYDNPAQEIKDRIKFVEEAFEAVSDGYEKIWSVNLDSDNDYIEKRELEIAQATHYYDGLIRYEIDDYCFGKNKDGIYCFRVVSAEGHDDTHLIAFCDIPKGAYFLKLTRID